MIRHPASQIRRHPVVHDPETVLHHLGAAIALVETMADGLVRDDPVHTRRARYLGFIHHGLDPLTRDR